MTAKEELAKENEIRQNKFELSQHPALAKEIDTIRLKLDKAIQVIEELSYGEILLSEMYFEKLGGKKNGNGSKTIQRLGRNS